MRKILVGVVIAISTLLLFLASAALCQGPRGYSSGLYSAPKTPGDKVDKPRAHLQRHHEKSAAMTARAPKRIRQHKVHISKPHAPHLFGH